jgi:predicted kinase
MKKSRLIEDMHILKESLIDLPEPVVKPPFVMVSGLPGTGKSYFCHRLAERVPLVILESDSLRKLLFASPRYTAEESLRLFRVCNYLIEVLLKIGIPLALDATNLEEHHRKHLYHIADQAGAKLIIVRVDAPPELVYQRLENRAKGIDPEDRSDADWKVYLKMKSSAQTISRSHFRVDTSRDISSAIGKIVHTMNQ